MGRPRGTGKNTAMVNGRITAEQMDWLLARADELDGNLSAALRQTITDARLLQAARDDFDHFLSRNPEFNAGYNEEGSSWVWHVALRWTNLTDAEDAELRSEEAGDSRAD